MQLLIVVLIWSYKYQSSEDLYILGHCEYKIKWDPVLEGMFVSKKDSCYKAIEGDPNAMGIYKLALS